MTEDLQDIAEHPIRAFIIAVFTLIILCLPCLGLCFILNNNSPG